MAKATYQSAGVDLDIYRESMARLPKLIERTRRPGVMDLPGGFAGLFRLAEAGRFDDPVLVSGTDGVGTKLKVAHAINRFDTVGIDLVAMCVNDCLCLGAEPLFFLDYVAVDRDDPDRLAALVSGIATGCEQAGAALLGGETAIMPSVYAPGEFDLAGFCVGVVERSKLVDGQAIRPGDQLIGIPSSGFHSNGYSLIRKVVFEMAQLGPADTIPELDTTVGDLLLTPTRIYAQLVKELMQTHGAAIHGMAHITGGGLVENVERILPAGLTLAIERSSPLPQAFSWIQNLGEIEDQEMERVFNCGIGYVLVVDPQAAAAIDATLRSLNEEPLSLGTVVNATAT